MTYSILSKQVLSTTMPMTILYQFNHQILTNWLAFLVVPWSCLWFVIVVVSALQWEGKILIDWFSFNCMQVNAENFQAIAVAKKKLNTIQFSTLSLWK